MRLIFSKIRMISELALLLLLFIFLIITFYRISQHPTPSSGQRSVLARNIRSLVEHKSAIGPDDEHAKKPSSDGADDAKRRKKIVEMTLHAWNGYRNFSWGANELKPIAKMSHSEAIFGDNGMMTTIVDAADTLWIMGLNREYKQAREVIVNRFKVSMFGSMSLFKVTIRHLGGLLSLHALTGEKVYIEKATLLTDLLMPAFDTPSGIPRSMVYPQNRSASAYSWVFDGTSMLSEVGSLHMEFTYLSVLTGNPVYRDKVNKVREVLDSAEKEDGLYSNFVSPETGRFVGSQISLGAFDELLIKSWIWSGGADTRAYRMYKNVSAAIRRKMVFKSKGGLTYVAKLNDGSVEHKMSHVACFSPGMFALEADFETDTAKKAELLELAEALGHTCHESYKRSASGIGPGMLYFGESSEAMAGPGGESAYVLRPEAIESWFYLWRITKKKKYKEWVWDAITAINRYCRVENGFAGLKNVYRPDEGFDDVQQTFFLSETLKYAYLTFADQQLPLRKWVFNTEAHPLPVQPKHWSQRGRHELFVR